MPKLKSLRAQVGTYGRVAANGIVEVDDPTARKLLDTKRFVKANADDIAAAKARMEAFVAGSAQGVPAGFAPIAQRAAEGGDELRLSPNVDIRESDEFKEAVGELGREADRLNAWSEALEAREAALQKVHAEDGRHGEDEGKSEAKTDVIPKAEADAGAKAKTYAVAKADADGKDAADAKDAPAATASKDAAAPQPAKGKPAK